MKGWDKTLPLIASLQNCGNLFLNRECLFRSLYFVATWPGGCMAANKTSPYFGRSITRSLAFEGCSWFKYLNFLKFFECLSLLQKNFCCLKEIKNPLNANESLLLADCVPVQYLIPLFSSQWNKNITIYWQCNKFKLQYIIRLCGHAPTLPWLK